MPPQPPKKPATPPPVPPTERPRTDKKQAEADLDDYKSADFALGDYGKSG